MAACRAVCALARASVLCGFAESDVLPEFLVEPCGRASVERVSRPGPAAIAARLVNVDQPDLFEVPKVSLSGPDREVEGIGDLSTGGGVDVGEMSKDRHSDSVPESFNGHLHGLRQRRLDVGRHVPILPELAPDSPCITPFIPSKHT